MVVDECHRATGKAEIVLALGHMRKARCHFRVLGLSATPGSNREAIQVGPQCSNPRSSSLGFRTGTCIQLTLVCHSASGCRACAGLCQSWLAAALVPAKQPCEA